MKYLFPIVLCFVLGCTVNNIPNKYYTGDIVRLKVSDKKFLVESYNSLNGQYILSYFDEYGYVRSMTAVDYAIEGKYE